MNIHFIKNGNDLFVALDGRLDAVTAPRLESFLESRCEGEGIVVLDCEKLTYVSSAGLRVLLGAQKRTKGAMKLIHVGESVMAVLEMTGFADILTIE